MQVVGTKRSQALILFLFLSLLALATSQKCRRCCRCIKLGGLALRPVFEGIDKRNDRKGFRIALAKCVRLCGTRQKLDKYELKPVLRKNQCLQLCKKSSFGTKKPIRKWCEEKVYCNPKKTPPPVGAPVDPTDAPFVAPTDAPVAVPTDAPVNPTSAPVPAPTPSPTVRLPQPTLEPTPEISTTFPTPAPSEAFTLSPTFPFPTVSPTQAPSDPPSCVGGGFVGCTEPTRRPTPPPFFPTQPSDR